MGLIIYKTSIERIKPKEEKVKKGECKVNDPEKYAKCPVCKCYALKVEFGCIECLNCGYSKCE